MFGYMHSFIREMLVREIQNLLDGHPYYKSTITDQKLQQAPVIVSEKYNFDGRQFPAVVIDSSSASEFRLDFTNFIEGVQGHCRITEIVPYIIHKIEDDPTYTGSYTNQVYSVEFANVLREDKREMKLRVIDGDGNDTYFDVAPWEVRNDIIPGARIMFGPFNDLVRGKKIYIETFENMSYLGQLYGKAFNFEVSINIYAQTNAETKELTDLVNAFFVYLIPQRIHHAHGIVLRDINTTGLVDKDGEIGEEVFKGTFSVSGWTEHHFFRPVDQIAGYNLWLELRNQVDEIVDTLGPWDGA